MLCYFTVIKSTKSMHLMLMLQVSNEQKEKAHWLQKRQPQSLSQLGQGEVRWGWVGWRSRNETWTQLGLGWEMVSESALWWWWNLTLWDQKSSLNGHKVIPVCFLFDLAPSSPFCFFLCRERTNGSHFSGKSFSTVILTFLSHLLNPL